MAGSYIDGRNLLVEASGSWSVDARDSGVDAELREHLNVTPGCETPAAALPDPQGGARRPLRGHGVAQAGRGHASSYGNTDTHIVGNYRDSNND